MMVGAERGRLVHDVVQVVGKKLFGREAPSQQGSWPSNDALMANLERILLVDVAHIDALGEVSPNKRPVILCGIVDGFDLILLESGDLAGACEEFEIVRDEYSLAKELTASVRRDVGGYLSDLRAKFVAGGGDDWCFEWNSDDGSRYVVIPSDKRTAILECFGVGKGDMSQLTNYAQSAAGACHDE